MMNFIIPIVIAGMGVLVLVAAYSYFRQQKPIHGIVFTVLGLAAIVGVLIYWARGIVIPVINLPWLALSAAFAVAFIVIGLFGKSRRPGVAAIGLAFVIMFLYTAFAPSIWFLILGLIGAVLLACSWVYRKEALVIAGVIALFVATIVGVTTHSGSSTNTEDQLRASLLAQVAANNKTFVSWDDLCKQAPAGSSDAFTCQKVNALQSQVDGNTANIKTLQGQVAGNTTTIKTLTGKVAKVTERVTKDEIVIKSNAADDGKAKVKAPAAPSAAPAPTAKPAPKPVDQDSVATAALAKQLAAAGWTSGDVSINKVDNTIHTDQHGTHAFGSRITTKAQLVKVLNGSSPQQQSIRNRVLDAVPTTERARLLSGDGYYALQFKKPLCLSGNDWFKDGKSVDGDGSQICHTSGDVLWVYVGSDGVVYWGATVRDDCNNPHLDTAPAPQNTPPATKVCAPGTDRAGQMVGSGCNNPKPPVTPAQPSSPPSAPSSAPGTTPQTVPNSTTPQTTPSSSPPKTTTPPSSTTPKTTTPPATTPPPETSTPPETTTPPKTTTPPSSTTPKTTTPPATTTSLAPKTGSNSAITQSESHSVNTNDGNTDSQGRQDDPKAGASSAAASASSSHAVKSSAASASASQADNDSGGGSDPHGSVTIKSSSTGSSSSTSASAPQTCTGPAGEDICGNAW